MQSLKKVQDTVAGSGGAAAADRASDREKHGINGSAMDDHDPDSYTTTVAFLETLYAAGITHCFVNLGSDHPSFLEAVARAAAGHGRKGALPMPEFVPVTHEMVAMSAAQGYYQATGNMAALILHVDCGLLNAGGAIHNIARARIPMLIFAGMSALTLEGELRGSRTEFINHVQDVHDMPGIVRNYSKFSYEFRTGRNIPQVTMRAVQIAMTEPRGPVYLFGSREVLEENLPYPTHTVDLQYWQPIEPCGLLPEQVVQIVSILTEASNPLVITSWAGDNPAAAIALRGLCEHLNMPVLEASPFALNMPAEHPLNLGSHWSGMGQHPALAEADVVIIIDSDIPFITIENRPKHGATVIHIDSDPLKLAMPLFYVPALLRYGVRSAIALEQIRKALPSPDQLSKALDRSQRVRSDGNARSRSLQNARQRNGDGPQHAPVGLAILAKLLPKDTFVISESISNYGNVLAHIGVDDSSRFATSGASSLGYGGGASVGAKIALQTRSSRKPGLTRTSLVCCITGDGSYMFSVPSSVQHLATRMRAPILTVILANGGWKSPQQSAVLVHNEGFAAKATAAQVGVTFGPVEDRPDYPAMAVAAAGGPHRAWGARVICGSPQMEETFKRAITETQAGKCATVELVLPEI